MEENNPIANITRNASLIPSEEDRKYFNSLSSDTFYPTLKLLQGTSPELGNDEDLKAGNFFISIKNIKLSNKILICVCARRAHALLIENGRKVKESFDRNSPIFTEIVNTPSLQDQSVVSSYSIGDFLIYLPEEDEFVVYFPGKRSSRPIALTILDHMSPPEQRSKHLQEKDLPHTNCFQLFSRMQDFGPKYRAYVPQVTPLEPLKEYFPEEAAYNRAVNLFMAPVHAEQKVEVAEKIDEVER